MKRTLIVLAAVSAAFAIRAEDATVEASGIGATYRAAVNEALATALEQKCGVTFSASERSQMASSETSVSSSGGDVDRVAVNDSIAKSMRKLSGGKISGYDVAEERFDPLTKKYHVRLVVRFPGRYVVGLDPNNRRRMAVMAFRPVSGDSVSWYGQAESSAGWAAELAAKISERFTRTRKFTMLDRKFDAEVTAELARLSGANASPDDAVRLNQKLGTDYLVVGDVKFFPVLAPGVNPLTGQVLPQTSQLFAEVSYRVLLAPTGQIKWQDTVKVDAMQCSAATIGEFVSRSADMAATLICDATTAAILPMEIVGKTADGTFVVGEGGKSLVPGEIFNVFALGEEVKDSRTGETLDQIEVPVGAVKIARVTEKLSYATFMEGDASKMIVGSRLRRAPVPAAPSPTIPMTTTIKSNGGTGVVVPF